MPIDIDRFLKLRPYVYHVTASENHSAIAETMELQPAATILRWAGRTDLLRWRRAELIRVNCGIHPIVLKDQGPLIEKNMSLGGGWEFGDFVEYLNQHVFFWPGTSEGPIKSGLRLQGRYEGASSVTLRVPTADLLQSNIGEVPLFCAFNSGAPRQQGGKRILRDRNLFVTEGDFPRRESEVVELAFRSAVVLPGTIQIYDGNGWVALTPLPDATSHSTQL